MMPSIKPGVNDCIEFQNHAMVWVISGSGVIEVDFRTYTDIAERVLFLSPGQYLKTHSDEIELDILDFNPEEVKMQRDFRVLFKHLISLGYIELRQGKSRFQDVIKKRDHLAILDQSTVMWYVQNPFNADKSEYTVLFDLKDVVDEHFRERLSVERLISQLSVGDRLVKGIVRDRLGMTIKSMVRQKLMLECQRELAFTDKTIGEVAFDYNFSDTAYFHRVFKHHTGMTPVEFKTVYSSKNQDKTIVDLLLLIRQYHKAEHLPSFYAEKLFISHQALARKVKTHLNTSISELIRQAILNSARKLLLDMPVKEVAWELGFREANHFSAFFKKYTGKPPTTYQSEKYN